MTPVWLETIKRIARWEEAISSVAMSHAEGCECDVCKANRGDEGARARVIDAMEAHG